MTLGSQLRHSLVQALIKACPVLVSESLPTNFIMDLLLRAVGTTLNPHIEIAGAARISLENIPELARVHRVDPLLDHLHVFHVASAATVLVSHDEVDCNF